MTSESASTPTGSVPGMRLASAENALRAFPGGKRKGAVTNPGRRSSSGRRARLATSNPDTTDPRKKLTASVTSAPSRMRAPCGGRSARLAQVAPAAATSPTGRSAAFHPEIASQKAKKSAPRVMAAPASCGGFSSSCALKDGVRRRPGPRYRTFHKPPAVQGSCPRKRIDSHAQLPYRRNPANAAPGAVQAGDTILDRPTGGDISGPVEKGPRTGSGKPGRSFGEPVPAFRRNPRRDDGAMRQRLGGCLNRHETPPSRLQDWRTMVISNEIRNSVDEFLARFRSAWDAGDARAYAAEFTEDASHVVFLGEAFMGRGEIERNHVDVFERWQKGTK